MESSEIESLRVRRIQQWIRLLFLCVATAGMWTAPNAGAASFNATLEPDTVALGDTAALKLVFEASGQIQMAPVPSIPGLAMSRPEQSRSTSIVNGVRTDLLTVTYQLRPTRTNVFTIPSLTARIGGEAFQSLPLTLKVVNGTQSRATQALAALRLVVPREQIYIGESVIIELQLLLDQTVSDISQFAMPNFSSAGWMAGEPMQGHQRQAQFGGRRMKVIPIRIPLTPLVTGRRQLGQIESSVVVQVPLQPRRNDPFGGFGLFQRTQQHRVPLSLPAHSINVLPLPSDGAPRSFTGAIGRFEMAVTAGPTNVTVGDPITLRVQISGSGNMNSVSLQEPITTGDFKTYEPEVKLDTTDDFGFVGMKTLEQIVVPENTEVRELPPIEFSYFDPEAGVYRTLTHPATPLQVMPAGSRPAPLVAAGNSPGTSAATRQDIVHIKQRLGTVQPLPGGSVFSARFYVWTGMPMMAWLGVVAWRKRQEIIGRNPRLRRQQEVRRRIAAGLKELEQFSPESRPEDFFATVFRLLQEQIGLCLDQPASGITESVVDEKLAPMNVNDPTLTTLHELFQSCNVARYAPTKNKQELAVVVLKLQDVLAELEEVRS